MDETKAELGSSTIGAGQAWWQLRLSSIPAQRGSELLHG
jgi:hypothetical protein